MNISANEYLRDHSGQQIEMAYQNARRTLKKRIKNGVWLSNCKCTSMGKKFVSCSSKYVFNFPAPRPPLLFHPPQLLIFNIFSKPPFIPTRPFIQYYRVPLIAPTKARHALFWVHPSYSLNELLKAWSCKTSL